MLQFCCIFFRNLATFYFSNDNLRGCCLMEAWSLISIECCVSSVLPTSSFVLENKSINSVISLSAACYCLLFNSALLRILLINTFATTKIYISILRSWTKTKATYHTRLSPQSVTGMGGSAMLTRQRQWMC